MRLQHFINENSYKLEPLDISRIKKECSDYLHKDKLFPEQYFIRQINSISMNIFYNNYHKFLTHPMMELQSYINTGRNPLDTPKNHHNTLNYYFNKKFGWNCRDGVFACRSKYHYIKDKPHIMIIPISKIEYVWSSSIVDLWTHKNMFNDDHLIRELVDTYTDKNIEKIKNQEISFKCNKYYCIYIDKHDLKYSHDNFINEFRNG